MESDRPRGPDLPTPRVNPGYAGWQLHRALVTAVDHEDPDVRARARRRAKQWSSVLDQIVSGRVDYGSRTPVAQYPAWVTLEVVTGGFATGTALAGGDLAEDELAMLREVAPDGPPVGRMLLNRYFLSEHGQARLLEWIDAGTYRIQVPEEGALPVVALLLSAGQVTEALDVIDAIEPFFQELRFYPRHAERPEVSGTTVHVRSVEEVMRSLLGMEPPKDLLKQREAVGVWAPLLDKLVGHFLETFEDGWPLRRMPEGWVERGRDLERTYRELRRQHRLCGKPERSSGHFAQLREFLRRCTSAPQHLDGREVGRLRLIVLRHIEKWGEPGSDECRAARARQRGDVDAVLHRRIAEVIAERLKALPPESGIPNPDAFTNRVETSEERRFGVPEGTPVPASVFSRVERGREDSIDALVERGLITSGDMLARLLPQVTAKIHGSVYEDRRVAGVFEGIYRAFRERRSLLLLDLQSQVRLSELPWIRALQPFENAGRDPREAAMAALRDMVALQLNSFPYAIVPNTLTREVRALARTSGLKIPLVEELAADIFMGRFSDKFAEAALLAMELLEGTPYATYYGITPVPQRGEPGDRNAKPYFKRLFNWPRKQGSFAADSFAALCHARAGVKPGGWNVVENGMVIEQQQILTTQNLAVLYGGLDLAPRLQAVLPTMTKHCLSWVLARQQSRIDDPHAQLIMMKNTAYAWRQMLFFLSFLASDEREDFLEWGTDLLHEQDDSFAARFSPAWQGVLMACSGATPPRQPTEPGGACRFLGWTRGAHWLLQDTADHST